MVAEVHKVFDTLLPLPSVFDYREAAFAWAFVVVIFVQLIFLFKKHTPVRPLLFMGLEALLSPLIIKLNRKERGFFALTVRGMLVLSFVGGAGAATFALLMPYNAFRDFILILFSVSSVSFIAFAFFYARDKKDNKALLLNLSQSSSTNLIHHDEYGLNRSVVNFLSLNFMQFIIAPFVAYWLLAFYGVFFYYTALVILNVSGRAEYGGYFTLFARIILTPIFYISQFITMLLFYFSSLFAGRKSIASNVGNIFQILKVKKSSIFEGGLALSMMSIALGCTLGGPYQDKYGQGVSAKWVGAEGTTSQVKKSDVLRATYLTFVALILFCLFLSVLMFSSWDEIIINKCPGKLKVSVCRMVE